MTQRRTAINSNKSMDRQSTHKHRSPKLDITKQTQIDADPDLDGFDGNILTPDELHALANLHLRKGTPYRHLINSYNAFLEESVVAYLTNGYHTFFESRDDEHLYRYRFVFSNIRISGPRASDGRVLYPIHATQHSLTYSARIYADITQMQDIISVATNETTTNVVGKQSEYYHIATVPLMLRSKWCSLTTHPSGPEYDLECEFVPGGYFLIGGNSKVLMSMDKMVENKPMVFHQKDSGQTTYFVQINSRAQHPHGLTQVLQIRLTTQRLLLIKVPILNEVNVAILLRALGVVTDREIIRIITYDETDSSLVGLVRKTLAECTDARGRPIRTQQDALDYLATELRELRVYSNEKEEAGAQKRMRLDWLLKTSFIPHADGSPYKKALCIGHMINRLLRVVLGRIIPDERDSYLNKRIDLAGDLMFEMFQNHFKLVLGTCRTAFSKQTKSHANPRNIIASIDPSAIESGFKKALSSGTWLMRNGVSQVLGNWSITHLLEFMRRVDAPGSENASAKLTTPRRVAESSVPFLDPSETPEHEKVGLAKQLSLISSATIASLDQTRMLKRYLIKHESVTLADHITYEQLHERGTYYKVMLNGDWLGMTDDVLALEQELRQMKLQGKVDRECVSIVVDHNEGQHELRVYSDSGRMVRPMLCVKDNVVQLTSEHIARITLNPDNTDARAIFSWEEFLNACPNTVEFICTEAQAYLLLAPYVTTVYKERAKMVRSLSLPNGDGRNVLNRYDEYSFVKYSHCEIHPALLFGICATGIPFGNHNAGTRCVFSFSQNRQAMGIPRSDYRHQLENFYVLHHCQTKLVSTRTAIHTAINELPTGENCIVAIATYSGFNQEDSLLINLTSVQRGKFNCDVIRKHASVEQDGGTASTMKFMKPDPSKVAGGRVSYDKLNDQGYAPPETRLKANDAILGLVSMNEATSKTAIPYRDKSEVHKGPDGTVDRVFLDIRNQKNNPVRKANVRSLRVPMVGDKFASTAAQKGTAGILIKSIDMPITESGIIPDIIMNSHAFPSRMTLGQLIECVVGKAALCEGCLADGTAFDRVDLDLAGDILERYGFARNGTETMYNGMTGEVLQTAIFIGPTYYLRLKHLVADKCHSRGDGPKTVLTHQPSEGRARNGGLRIGEMEKDTINAHGMAYFAKEKMMNNSDAFVAHVCGKCGLFATRAIDHTTATFPRRDDSWVCISCRNLYDIHKIEIPYAYGLFCSEQMALSLAPRFMVKKSNVRDDA